MSFVIDNLRLRELALVAEQNKTAFEDLVAFLKTKKYESLRDFILDTDEARGQAVILEYLNRPYPPDVFLYDGIARPYAQEKAKWLILGWVLRDAPEQRLRPMVSSMPGNTPKEKQAYLYNQLRKFIGSIFPEQSRWEWTAISEVFIDRLEGSRRSIKGTLFEVIVRRNLQEAIKSLNGDLKISDNEIKLEGETYDVCLMGKSGRILLPVKTRETMGGGHALLFTRDIHKSIAVAHDAGFECLPIIIAESWTGDLSALACKDYIYINQNPNQILVVEPILANELKKRRRLFSSII